MQLENEESEESSSIYINQSNQTNNLQTHLPSPPSNYHGLNTNHSAPIPIYNLDHSLSASNSSNNVYLNHEGGINHNHNHHNTNLSPTGLRGGLTNKHKMDGDTFTMDFSGSSSASLMASASLYSNSRNSSSSSIASLQSVHLSNLNLPVTFSQRSGSWHSSPRTYSDSYHSQSGANNIGLCLVIGGSGFLGRHLCEQLLRNGFSVRSFDNRDTWSDSRINFHVGDISNYDQVKRACLNVDVIFHTASLTAINATWDEYQKINVHGTNNIINAALECGVSVIVYTSSTSVIIQGTDIKNAQEDQLPYPSKHLDYYSKSKALAEELIINANGRITAYRNNDGETVTPSSASSDNTDDPTGPPSPPSPFPINAASILSTQQGPLTNDSDPNQMNPSILRLLTPNQAVPPTIPIQPSQIPSLHHPNNSNNNLNPITPISANFDDSSVQNNNVNNTLNNNDQMIQNNIRKISTPIHSAIDPSDPNYMNPSTIDSRQSSSSRDHHSPSPFPNSPHTYTPMGHNNNNNTQPSNPAGNSFDSETVSGHKPISISVPGSRSRYLVTCSIRPHAVFGPRDTHFLSKLIDSARGGDLTHMIGDGTNVVDFTYVGNVVHAEILAMCRLFSLRSTPSIPPCGQCYFITNGEPRQFWDFVSTVLVEAGCVGPTKSVPFAIAYAIAWLLEFIRNIWAKLQLDKWFPFNPTITRHMVVTMGCHHYFSHKKASRHFGYKPIISLDEGLAHTIAYFMQRPQQSKNNVSSVNTLNGLVLRSLSRNRSLNRLATINNNYNNNINNLSKERDDENYNQNDTHRNSSYHKNINYRRSLSTNVSPYHKSKRHTLYQPFNDSLYNNTLTSLANNNNNNLYNSNNNNNSSNPKLNKIISSEYENYYNNNVNNNDNTYNNAYNNKDNRSESSSITMDSSINKNENKLNDDDKAKASVAPLDNNNLPASILNNINPI